MNLLISHPVFSVQDTVLQRSLIAQLVEHSAVNRVVTGSSPVRGAITERCPSLVEGARLEIV